MKATRKHFQGRGECQLRKGVSLHGAVAMEKQLLHRKKVNMAFKPMKTGIAFPKLMRKIEIKREYFCLLAWQNIYEE